MIDKEQDSMHPQFWISCLRAPLTPGLVVVK